jgi:hypothetical protein
VGGFIERLKTYHIGESGGEVAARGDDEWGEVIGDFPKHEWKIGRGGADEVVLGMSVYCVEDC